MARAKEGGKALNCNIDRQFYARLEGYCHEVGQAKTMAIERFLNHYFNDYYSKSKKQ